MVWGGRAQVYRRICERRLFHAGCEKVWRWGGRDGHGQIGVSRQGSQWGRNKDTKGRGSL